MNTVRTFILILFLAASAACTASRIAMKTPEDFALFDREHFYKAVSADAVHVTVREVKEESLEKNNGTAMWAAETERTLTLQGYSLQLDKEISTDDGLKGPYREYSVVFNGDDYRYAIALFFCRETLYIVEAGGEAQSFEKKRDAILNSIKSFQVSYQLF